MISIIVAVAENGVIGKTDGLPWYLPADLARFKQITMGHPIIMGRVTHQSIGRALPGRRNIVITHDKKYKAAEGCEVVDSLEEALKLAKNNPEVFIIGGASIYEQALLLADKIYLTRVHAKIDGDKFFKYNLSEWQEVSNDPHKADEKHKYAYDFAVLERIDSALTTLIT